MLNNKYGDIIKKLHISGALPVSLVSMADSALEKKYGDIIDQMYKGGGQQTMNSTPPAVSGLPVPSETLTLLFLSFAITWIIGLTPPLLIRYVFLRRPMSKKTAIITIALFYLFNLFLFIAMGSTSKSHAAVLLIAFVSYWILRKERHSKKSVSRKETTQEEVAHTESPSTTSRGASTSLEIETKVSSIKVNSWWRNRSSFFRIWIFVSIIWIVTVFLYLILFDPEEIVYSRYGLDGREVFKLLIIMAIPLIAGGLKYVYDKIVK